MKKLKNLLLVIFTISTALISVNSINSAEAQEITEVGDDCVVSARYVFNFQQFTFILKCDNNGSNYHCLIPCENKPNN